MTEEIATAKEWAAMTFEPVIDDSESKFNMPDEMKDAQKRAMIKGCGLTILRRSDEGLTEMVASSGDPDVLMDLYDSLGQLVDYYRNGIECAEAARARLMVAMTRFCEREGVDLNGSASS